MWCVSHPRMTLISIHIPFLPSCVRKCQIMLRACARNVSSCAALYRMAMKKRADLCPSEADALNLSMAMWVTPFSEVLGRFYEHFVRVSCFATKLLNPVPGRGRQPRCCGRRSRVIVAFVSAYGIPSWLRIRIYFGSPIGFPDGLLLLVFYDDGSFCGSIHPFVLPKLIDFGIFVLAIKGFPRLLLTRTPIRVGTIVIFFMSGVGWERFLGKDRQSESSLCWAFGSVPNQYMRDIKGLTLLEQAHVDAILEVGSIDWNALVCRENEGWLGYTMFEPSLRANPSSRSERSPRGRLPREDSRKESSRVSVGGTKRRNSQEVEGSSHGHSSKKRRASPSPMVLEAEEEEAEEAPLARMSSKRAANNDECSSSKILIHLFISRDFVDVWLFVGLEDVSPMLSPTSRVRMEIPVPAVKVIREIEAPSFSISLTAPPGHGELPSSSRISNLTGTLTSER
ncbi:hypothetical protein CJ030_MR2G011722 [Morella rubra]|uniref:Uncharacterized protein n=1 Tax=Morella rubra TaxID=262757 RepID=A0A6A1WEI2_9ROSI|nr:hypothetical protein CJ030_MR2G011722 [Morella rubra]